VSEIEERGEALYREALQKVATGGKASVSLIQRLMRIGYTAAAKIIDRMEAEGHIGQYNGNQPREVHITPGDIPQTKPKRAPAKNKTPEKGKTATKKKTPKKAPQREKKAKTSREGVGGRKELWHTLEMHTKLDAVRGWAMQGATMEELAIMLGVGETTIYKWQAERPEFAKAIRAGRHISNGELLNAAFRNSTGFTVIEKQAIKIKTYEQYTDPKTAETVLKPVEKVEVVEVESFVAPNAKLLQFMLTNRMPDQYKNKEHVDIVGGAGGFGYRSDEELEAEIAALESVEKGEEPNVH